MVNEGNAFQQTHEINRAIVELQAQIRKLRKQVTHMKKVMKEPPCFDGFSLDLPSI